ncbi:MAG: VWA domain-containing protein [Planctomycetaceae bacterium]
MTFLNGALTFGALAFAIPLIIHILNRSRFRTVAWGAMHLLESVIKVNHKRFRIDQLILLLVRCAIPVLLALCLAKPVLTGSRLLEGDSPVSLVILLDTSYSMDTVDSSGSRFHSAVDAACAIVSAVSRGSEVSVIQTGGRPTPLFDQPVFDPEAVIRKLKQIPAGYGASDMQASLDEALTTLSGMKHARRELIVISDFQPADWEAIGANAAESIRRQVEAMSIKPELTLLPIGKPVDGNISVDSLEIPRRALGVGQQLAVRANVKNHGTAAIDHARVLLRIDGTESSVSQTALGPNGTTQVLFSCTFDKSGSHVVEVEVVADDPLTDDNRYAAAVTVWDSINVLLVDGDPSGQPLQSETDYLSIALTPYTFGRVRLADLVQTQTVLVKDVTEEKLKTARVVVLANVSKLEPAQVTALTAFVQDGGALLFCAGNRIDLAWYREQMFANGTGLLPAAIGTLRGQIDDAGQSAHVVAQHFDHPALEFFNDAANGDLSAAEIRKWHELSEIDLNAGAIILARLDNGDPFLVERRFGDGVVMQLATACDADWTDLPMRPFFVPLMQQLVTTMASGISPPRNIATGAAAVAVLPGDESAMTLSVVTPDGSRRTVQTVPQGKMQLARFDGTQRPGVYAMSTPSTETLHFVAESSREESNLSGLDEPGLVALARHTASTLVRTSAEYLEQDRLRRHGQEIWQYVLAAFLAFMFLELVLQQRFARVRA